LDCRDFLLEIVQKLLQIANNNFNSHANNFNANNFGIANDRKWKQMK